jgi:hypothetical protein
LLRSIAYVAIGPTGGTTLVGRISGIRTQSGQTIVNDGLKVKKIKVTLVQALRLCTGRTAHRGREV